MSGKRKYTREFLISELHRYFENTRNVPKHSDIGGEYPSYCIYRNYFGSWNNALLEAGFDLHSMQNYTNEYLISELQRYVTVNGVVPSAPNMTRSSGFPASSVYVKRFGTWNNALISAGLPIFGYTDDFLIAEIHRFLLENSRPPTYNDMTNDKGYPSAAVYDSHFGLWSKALEIAGIDKIEHIKETLIKDLYKFYINKGSTPITTDACNNNGLASTETYIRYFGSWNNALIAANIPVNRIVAKNHDGDSCTICNRSQTSMWCYDDNLNLICKTCWTRLWRYKNPDKVLATKYKHRGYGFNPINKKFDCSAGHHVHVEQSSDYVIFIPRFVHEMYWHHPDFPETMDSVNAVAFDFLIHEELYISLYLNGGDALGTVVS